MPERPSKRDVLTYDGVLKTCPGCGLEGVKPMRGDPKDDGGQLWGCIWCRVQWKVKVSCKKS